MPSIARGDTVVVTKGRKKGKRGKVKRVLKNGRVEIENIMMAKRHTKPTQKNPHGGIQDREHPALEVRVRCERERRERRTPGGARAQRAHHRE